MRKIVTTEMTSESVVVSIDVIECNEPSLPACRWSFPLNVVNPRVALQIATLLVSDPSIPSNDEK